ncbi:hypothetical protein SETIT_4G109300v2 [Setaria italica]|uniref:Uncharacterized protein n=2 Tax=Setaria italica TaxID=4555 RepID=A0A368QSZ9_SETIT|nr:hypothetical protein SETIT_4G109300v2 [Setaria italica]
MVHATLIVVYKKISSIKEPTRAVLNEIAIGLFRSSNMAITRVNIAAMPVILLLILALWAVSGAAKPLSSEVWLPAGEAVSGDEGVVQFLHQIYLQQLGAGPSCGTNSSNL